MVKEWKGLQDPGYHFDSRKLRQYWTCSCDGFLILAHRAQPKLCKHAAGRALSHFNPTPRAEYYLLSPHAKSRHPYGVRSECLMSLNLQPAQNAHFVPLANTGLGMHTKMPSVPKVTGIPTPPGLGNALVDKVAQGASALKEFPGAKVSALPQAQPHNAAVPINWDAAKHKKSPRSATAPQMESLRSYVTTSVKPEAVSYTHLTLPTNREV